EIERHAAGALLDHRGRERREPLCGLLDRRTARVNVRDHVAIAVGLAEPWIVDDVGREAVAGAEPGPLAEQDHRDLRADLLADLVLEPYAREPRGDRRADGEAARLAGPRDRIVQRLARAHAGD